MKTILVPVDFSPSSNNALRYAIHLSDLTHCRLIVYHAAFFPRFPAILPEKEYQKLLRKDERRKLEKLQKMVVLYCDKINKNIPEDRIKYIVENRSMVVQDIVDAAKTHKADLIVMGTHIAKGIRKVLLGSITVETIFNTSVPVLAIPPRFKFRKINTLLYASDFKQLHSELKIVLPIAKALDTEIKVLYLDYAIDKDLEIEKMFKKVVGRITFNKLYLVQKKVWIGESIPDFLRKFSVGNKDAVCIMFPEEKSWLDKLFMASKTEDLAYDLKIPLIAIRKELVT